MQVGHGKSFREVMGKPVNARVRAGRQVTYQSGITWHNADPL